jgi:hypothetical protein
MAARMRKRPDGRYCVSVTYEDIAGVRRRHYVYGKTQPRRTRRPRQLVSGSTQVRRSEMRAGRSATGWPSGERRTCLRAIGLTRRSCSTTD